ncbi:hypothetical protein ACETK8_15750 [Brevundimonas staleyi]|uniref:FCD domain-containing protein n=1 Tax=Brevundimonas staleyi TaxID=74326 RepID=A0ABW0FWW9_9CAUL
MHTAEQTPIPTCPVAATIPEALSLIRAIRRYEAPHCFELLAKTNERLDALEAAIVHLHATSTTGLFFQTCLAMRGAGWWSIYDQDDIVMERAQHRALNAVLRSMASSLYSEAVAVLAEHYAPEVVAEVRAA